MKVVKSMIMAAMIAAMSGAFAAVEWQNVDADHHLGGRKLSQGYLQGRVVLVCRNASMATKMSSIWDSFKRRSFALIGAFSSAAEGVDFPQYREAGLAAGAPETQIYVVDPTGKVLYKGESEQTATESVVTAITDWESPRDAKQFKRFLDWEITTLPGSAVLRFRELKKRFPKDASIKEYEGKLRVLSKIPGMGDLVSLVEKSHKVRNYMPKNAIERKKMPGKIKTMISKYAKLKEAADPQVAQEAKNAIADLVWASKEF